MYTYENSNKCGNHTHIGTICVLHKTFIFYRTAALASVISLISATKGCMSNKSKFQINMGDFVKSIVSGPTSETFLFLLPNLILYTGDGDNKSMTSASQGKTEVKIEGSS